MNQGVFEADVLNRYQLKQEHLDAISKYLFDAAKVDREISLKLARFLIDGTDEDVLLTLPANPDIVVELGFFSSRFVTASPSATASHIQKVLKKQGERAALLSPKFKAPPEFWVGFAKFLESAQRNSGASPFIPPYCPGWLGAILNEYQQATGKIAQKWSVLDLERMLISEGISADLLVHMLLDSNKSHGYNFGPWHRFLRVGLLEDLNAYMARHAKTVEPYLLSQDIQQSLTALQALSSIGFDFEPFLHHIVQMATGNSKQVRDKALSILSSDAVRQKSREPIEKILAGAAAAQRHEAAQLLWNLFGRESVEVLTERLKAEKSDRVRQTIERLICAPSSSVDFESLDPGKQIDIESGIVPLPETEKQKLREVLSRAEEMVKRQCEQQLMRVNPSANEAYRRHWMPSPLSDSCIEHIFDLLEGRADAVQNKWQPQYLAQASPLIGDWFAPPAVKLIHVVRLSFGANHLSVDSRSGEPRLYWYDTRLLELYRARCDGALGLREVDAATATLPGFKEGMVTWFYLCSNSSWASFTFCDWEPDAIWPAFAQHPEVLRSAMKSDGNRWDYNAPTRRQNVFRVLGMFPQLPAEFIPMLWSIALGEAKTDRPLAQAALASVPDKVEKITAALQDGKQGVRAAAAEWLGKLGQTAAVPAIKQAFRKEKNELVKGVMLTALDNLHADVDDFLDRNALLKEASAGMSKKLPKGIEWVPLESLPPIHWHDTGMRVDPLIVQWWLVQGIQQKSPACGPILRRYLSMCRKNDTAALARYILSSWIARDTSTLSAEEAAARAQEEADRLWNAYGSNPYYQNSYGGKTKLYEALLEQYSNQMLQSAIEQKGMLSLVSAAGDRDCAKMCEQYIRKFFGNRLAQCKCLIDVLDEIEDPLALQILLSIANRFRTKAIRQAAEERVQAIAERQNWTMDELADRTIPDAGFARPVDENGEPCGTEAILELDYGSRQFELRLDDALEPVITVKGEAKPLKALPAPGKNDDEEKAKEAKKLFSDAKKMVKETVKRQTERLYEALCTQRCWRFDDWQRYLAQHPIVGRMCVRLCWVAYEPAGATGDAKYLGCFRPLEDGSLTNENDESVSFSPDTLVSVAHSCNTPAEAEQAWLKHFEDYDVTPLFQQLGRPVYKLPEKSASQTDVEEFQGHMITTFRLRAKAGKLGWMRGEAEDGGWFYVYRKSFTSLGIQAVIEFTGSYLPEEDFTTALKSLYFTASRNDQPSWMASKLQLDKVPPVLLSECFNDLKQIAAEGTGYDADWERKSYL